MLRTTRRALGLLAPYRGTFAAGQIAALIATAAGLAFPWAVRGVFAVLLERQALSVLLAAVAMLGGVLAVQQIANLFKNIMLGRVGQHMIRDLRARAYGRLLQLSLDYYNHQSSGEIGSRMSNDMNLLQQGLASGLAFVIQQAVSLVVVVILLARIDPVLTLVVLATIPPIMVLSQRTGKKVKVIAQSTQERLGYLMSIIHESVSGIAVIKAFVLENTALSLFRDENERIAARSMEGIRVSARAGLAIGLLNGLFLLVVIGLGGYRTALGHLAPADLIAFILYAEMVAGPLATMAGLYVEVNKAAAAYSRIEDILGAESQVERRSGAPLPGALRGEIGLERVSFAYDEGHPVLHEIDLVIAPGQRVALVGPSGVGKSTLVKLIPRFYEPTAGRVCIDGLDIRTLDLKALREQIAIVPQETHLFSLSVADNIACGQPGATHEAVVHAAQMANAHDFITALPGGYQTMVGEDGARLSGGQRQRIAIARAFLKDPRILILDEATSALDSQSEALVHEALDRLMRGRTTVVIAHRLSTIRSADQIVVLDGGRVQAAGTHETLLDACPLYRDLYRQQVPGIPETALSF